MNACLTSSPTSNACGPMAGPSQASNLVRPRQPSPAPSLPARHPPGRASPHGRQPRPFRHRSQNSTGRQSAVITAQTMPGFGQLPSASGTPTVCSASTTDIAVHLFQPDRLGGKDARNSARLAATATGSSPTWSPRLKLAIAPRSPRPRGLLCKRGHWRRRPAQEMIRHSLAAAHLSQVRHVLRQFRLPFHFFAANRVDQPEPCGMQRLTRKSLDSGRNSR